MFKRDFAKSSSSFIKNSEIKALRERMLKSFLNFTTQDLDEIIPRKADVECMKIFTTEDKVVTAYCLQHRPVVFDIDGTIFPSVYLLWKFPKIALEFTTSPFVFSKIKGGAHLMLPGVLNIPDEFRNNSIAYVNTSENKAAIAVGKTCLAKNDIMSNSQKGVCVHIYHFFGDKLCTAHTLPLMPLPDYGIPDFLKVSEVKITDNTDETSSDPEKENSEPQLQISELTITDDTNTEKQEEVSDKDDDENMDKLLEYCFLVALKYSKSLEIPILTSTFYKLHMLAACPSGKSLDIKKSSYKKLTKFLKNMMKDGIITVKELKKGAESITAVNREHAAITSFYVSSEERPKSNTNNNQTKSGPNIIEEYIVTQNILPLFENTGVCKGDRLQATEVKKYITNFVKRNNCQDEVNKGLVKIQNPHLAAICKNYDVVSWEVLMQNVYKCMKSGYTLVSGEEEKLEKGKIQPISITVQTRTGNKKVTLIDNLQLFGINMAEFSKECQHGVAASTTITKVPGKKTEQLLVQGNQVLFVYNHLLEKYRVPKKYIKGLEFAPKNKK